MLDLQQGANQFNFPLTLSEVELFWCSKLFLAPTFLARNDKLNQNQESSVNKQRCSNKTNFYETNTISKIPITKHDSSYIQ